MYARIQSAMLFELLQFFNDTKNKTVMNISGKLPIKGSTTRCTAKVQIFGCQFIEKCLQIMANLRPSHACRSLCWIFHMASSRRCIWRAGKDIALWSTTCVDRNRRSASDAQPACDYIHTTLSDTDRSKTLKRALRITILQYPYRLPLLNPSSQFIFKGGTNCLYQWKCPQLEEWNIKRKSRTQQ